MELRTSIIQVFLLLTACAVARAQSEPVAEIPEVIVVTGRLPGPPLWKVSNGDNVLWIFATMSPVPKDMQWDSARVEKVLAEAEVYIPRPYKGIKVSLLSLLNPLNLVRGMRLISKMDENPDGKPLKETLTPDQYQRYTALKARYFPKNKSIEAMRPYSAMQKISNEILQSVGLKGPGDIYGELKRLVKKNHRLQTINASVEIEWKGSFKELAERAESWRQSLPPDKEQACFERTLVNLEQDLEAMKTRANEWAEGHIDEFRAVVLRNADEHPCQDVQRAGDDAISEVDSAKLVEEKWLATVDKTLTEHRIGFAVLDIGELLANDGLLSKLRAKGYSIREPQ